MRTREPAHLPLHRRLLFPTLDAERPLPPIVIPTASGSKRDPELEKLNDRLYHLIALILRAYVLSWYPRFSKDRSLLPTLSSQIVVPILSPILSGVYHDPNRILQLLLLDLPAIFSLHWSTYWQSRQAIRDTPHLFTPRSSDYIVDPQGTGPDLLGDVYHARLPLLSVVPSPGTTYADTEGPYRLPTPGGQYILSPLYLTSLADALIRLHLPPAEYGCTVERVMAREIVGRAVLGAIGRKLGEGWFWWSLGLKLMGGGEAPAENWRERAESGIESIYRLIIRVYSLLFFIWTFAVSLFARYTASPPSPPAYAHCAQPWAVLARQVLGVDGRPGVSPQRWSVRLIWGCTEGIITLLSPMIDRLLPHLLQSQLTPALSLRLIEVVEKVLFPLDGYPAPTPPDLTPEEAVMVRKQFEERLKGKIPRHIRAVLLPENQDIKLLLDPLDNPGCNAHLVGMLVDTIVGALEPGLVAPKTRMSEAEVEAW
ncbi:uncharacterized protein MKK02DRAFT_21848 [Dioszegia hungarica]|uniref:PXA domain-containing protein n=1 Tax=Dioszegia hungarica TaxID=4972 RepID=A0AA38HEK6_9TREE|nr:uncharacterized protein MKK02DRAFT_21848 [Dioszegia hungarica]KAI9638825.1 hypothetical protein MKK02DRAFT_21848 [Dioszegia hungarica]